jgi:branched-chain amino acid transport system permease protein
MSALKKTLPIVLFALAYAAIAMLISNSYYQLMMTLVLVWAIFGLSWNILSGYTGLVSFGHAAFFGIGAYTTVLGQIMFGLSPWVTIPIAAVLGGLAGLMVGFPTFRLRGHYFALAMLAYPLALLYVFEWLGYQELTIPMRRDAPVAFMQFSDPRMYTLIALVMLVGTVLVTRMIEQSRFGRALLAIKQNEAAAEAAGIDTLRWKLRAITVSGAIAGMIGAFYTVVLLVVTPPSVFGMLVSAQALTVAMFGGVGTVWGPVIGAVILIPISEILHAELGAKIPGIQGVVFGLAIMAVILLAPEGLYWRLRDMWRAGKREAVSSQPPHAEVLAEGEPRSTQRQGASFEAPLRGAPQDEVVGRARADADTIMSVQGISKTFGGLKAVQNVSFEVKRGEILGIIGPNGAGKTTLFNLLNGFLKPDEGRVLFEGKDVIGLMPHSLCELGVGRTFQVMRPFLRMSVEENVLTGAFVHAATDAEALQRAREAVAEVGLSDVAEKLGGELTTKQLRLMELARALAGRPRLLLLDETLAGLGHGEIGDVLAVIRRLAETGITIMIIEHTMGAMVQLVDRFVVLDHGMVLVEGEPQAVTKDPRVIEAYLGKKWSAAHAAA